MANCSSDVPFLQDDFSELLWDNGPVILQVPRKSSVMNQVEEKKDNEDCSLYPHIPHFEHIESKVDMFNSSNDYAIDQWNLTENIDYYSQTDLPNVEKEENIKSVALGSSSKSPMEVTSSFASSAVFEKHNACKGHETVLASSGSSAERATIDHYKRKSKNSKRNRAAEVHNLSERRRRDRINEKMRALQELIPNCNKTDKASMLDEAIEYLKSLQMQVQMMSMQRGLYVNPPMMMMHTPMPMFSPINMGIGWAPRCQYVPMAMFGNNNHKIPIPSSKNLERTGHINSKSTN